MADQPMPSGIAVDASVREMEYRAPRLNQQDLDRNFGLATTNLFKWMQAARMDLPWMQSGYRALGWLEPPMPRRLLVASQMVRLVRPGVLCEAVNSEVVTRCEVGTIGKTSIEFRYKIFFGEQLAGTGTTTMVVVSGEPGNLKPTPVPEAIRPLANPVEGEDRALLQQTLAAQPAKPPGSGDGDGGTAPWYRVGLIVRYSDEDVNKHANHSALARFFEDAKDALAADPAAPPSLKALASQQIGAVLIAYAAEARAEDRCEVRVARGARPGALDVWVVRLAPNRWGSPPGLVGRGSLLCGGGPPEPSEALRTRLASPAAPPAGARL